MKQWWESFLDWFCHRAFRVHDRTRELHDAASNEIRSASHKLANAAMVVETSSQEVRRQADALSDLIRRAHKMERPPDA